jgi:GAF domain-containing protein
MSATPESTLADPQQIIADLQRQVAECRAERDEALAECDKAQRRLVERTAERDEALEQQTATAEVLQVINSSPGDLAPVFDAVLDKATRCCDAAFGTLWTYDGDSFNAVALQQVPEAYAEFLSQAPLRPVPFSGLGRVAAGESVAHFVDVAANEAYGGGDPALRALLELGKARSTVAVPLRKDNTVLGAITAYRQEVRPFSDKQIALLQNFAAQAVIAMENARLITETREALEQQTATAEVLGVINSSPGDLKPVFDALLEKATRLCEGSQGVLWTLENDSMRCAAMFGATPEYAAFLLRGASPGPATPMGRILRGERVIEIRDLAEDEGYRAGDPVPRAAVEMGGLRSMIFVALVREETLLGGFAIARPEVRPFTDKQIALLQNFAAQAVIAMENARLITETREALEQQTATAEVLQVINSSPGDLTPVFDAILEKAHSLCGAAFGGLLIYDGDRFKAVALHNVPPAFAEIARQGFSATPPNPIARLLEGEPLVQIADLKEIAEVAPTGSLPRAGVDLAGIRTLLLVPLRKGDALLGVITAYRQEVCRFSDKQIALLQNFAAQAVIAIENARLITETREALEQQTATAEVLQVINSSPGALGPVFDAMLEKAMHLCSADFGVMNTYDGKHFHHAADQGVPLAYARYRRERGPTTYGPGTTPARLVAGENLIHTADLMATEAYERAEPARRALVDLGGAHTHLTAALRKGDVLLGDISIYRQEVRPFADKQIALLENFAAQAVIAMENARLLTETREALEQQTATGEVLQVINSSPGDLEPVFDAILEKALHLCGAAHGHVFRVEGDLGRAVAACGDRNSSSGCSSRGRSDLRRAASFPG